MKKWKAMAVSVLAGLSLYPGKTAGQPATPPVIRFGLVADIQYGDCHTQGNRYYRNSLQKLDTCIRELNQRQVRFTVVLGDLADRSPEDLERVTERLKKLNAKVCNLPGNHDYNGITDNRVLFKKLGMPKEYYTFRQGNWRFVMLNTNEIASYSHVKGTWKENELAAMTERIRAAGRNNDRSWNGGISSKQLKWLHELLESAEKKGEKVLIFSHSPLYPATMFTALNDQEILDTIARFTCVKGIISGHHHQGAFAYYRGIPCITTEGMIETESENAFGIVEIFENEWVLTGFGRTRSYRFPLR